jgi:hypothetical protein
MSSSLARMRCTPRARTRANGLPVARLCTPQACSGSDEVGQGAHRVEARLEGRATSPHRSAKRSQLVTDWGTSNHQRVTAGLSLCQAIRVGAPATPVSQAPPPISASLVSPPARRAYRRPRRLRLRRQPRRDSASFMLRARAPPGRARFQLNPQTAPNDKSPRSKNTSISFRIDDPHLIMIHPLDNPGIITYKNQVGSRRGRCGSEKWRRECWAQ